MENMVWRKKTDVAFLAIPPSSISRPYFAPGFGLSFGFVISVSHWQHLARLEMRIIWEELLPRLKSVELTGPAKRVGASFVSGPFSVPIKFELE